MDELISKESKKAWGFKQSKSKRVLPVAFPTREQAREWKTSVKSEEPLKEIAVSVTEVF